MMNKKYFYVLPLFVVMVVIAKSSVFHNMVRGGFASIRDVQDLVKEQGIDINKQDEQGTTALHHAASALTGRNVALVEWLVRNGAKKGIKNKGGQTAYDIAEAIFVEPSTDTREGVKYWDRNYPDWDIGRYVKKLEEAKRKRTLKKKILQLLK